VVVFEDVVGRSYCKRLKRDLVRYQRLNIANCIVASNSIYDQPDDGLEKRPKRVVALKVRYVNKAP
jgi:hypothetical protein